MLNRETRIRIEEIKMRLNRVEDRKLIDDLANLVDTLRAENHLLKQKSIEDSWARNPDTSGGAFTQDEINRSREERW